MKGNDKVIASPIEIVKKYSVIATAVVLIVIATIATGGKYLTAGNMLNVGERASAIGIISLGQMLVILTGGLDLSVSGIVAVGYCITSLLLAHTSLPVPLVILFMLLGTTACGALNGFLVSKTRVPPFMLTLGTFLFFQSLSLVLSKAATLYFNTQAGWMVNTLGLRGTIGRLFPSITWVVVSALIIIILAYARFGKNIYQTGGKEMAAKMSGIKTDQIKFLVYTICGLLCGIAALTVEFRINFLNVTSTSSFQIASIAAVIIGGTSLLGGEGNVYGTFVGAFIMASLDNIMNLCNVNVYSQDIVKGIVLLFFVCISFMMSKNRLRAS
ncbi:ribose ABC transporter permease [Spirochaetia bacterium]|nr:ribose ABC transporter permease [Spirochaetia bacterium]